MDSVPLIAITGQVPRHVIGTDAFQETPMVEVSRAITKHHYLVQDATGYRADRQGGVSSGEYRPSRPGVDRHAQGHAEHGGRQSGYDVAMDLPGYRLPPPPSPEKIHEVLAAIKASSRPIIYCGGGVMPSERGRRAARVFRQDGHSGGDDRSRPGCDPQRPLPVAQHAGHARHGLRELCRQRGRFAAGLRRPIRRPGHRQTQRVRQARQDRPRGHRRVRDQQEQVRPHPDQRAMSKSS